MKKIKFARVLVVYSEKISPGHRAAVQRVCALLPRQCRRVRPSRRLRAGDLAGVELVLTVGGDGAFIRAARYVSDQLIMGINSEPEFSEGALASLADDQLERLPAVLAGDYRLVTRARGRVTINGRLLAEPVLNEVYVGARSQFHTSRYVIVYRGMREEQRSSGVLVVTGSGSTAWFRAVGGRPFSAAARRMAFIVREPYRGRVFRGRLLAGDVGPDETVGFESGRISGGVIALDANTAYAFNCGDQARVGPGDCPLRVVVPGG